MPAQPITFFEITTAAAFLAFSRSPGRFRPARGRARRPARRDQCRRRARRSPRSPRSRSTIRLFSATDRGDRRREGRHPQAGRAGGDRRRRPTRRRRSSRRAPQRSRRRSSAAAGNGAAARRAGDALSRAALAARPAAAVAARARTRSSMPAPRSPASNGCRECTVPAAAIAGGLCQSTGRRGCSG